MAGTNLAQPYPLNWDYEPPPQWGEPKPLAGTVNPNVLDDRGVCLGEWRR